MRSPVKLRLAIAIALAVALLAGCAPATRVVLLPQPGRSTAVEVSAQEGKTVLASPYAQAEVSQRGQVATDTTDAQTVEKRYGNVLKATPAAALHFTLYFTTGTSELTPESSAELQGILTQATARPGGEIFITGHTDTMGAGPANDALSLKRAQAVRQLVIDRGFEADRVVAAGRGEREPVVPTADEVDEPKNRRVEIEVR